ncbi:MAG: capsular biosynthesis protein [Bacteroidetes bacterium]|nr:MAG: capsular biosynthesis protein [Bacteroidota bacterium]
MPFWNNLFSADKSISYGFEVDFHSHLLPNIDDGVKSFEESALLINELKALGIKKIITTPHTIAGHYPNTSEIILNKLAELQHYLTSKQIEIQIEAASEYYLDETLIQKIKNNEKLLTFGDNFLLFELSYINESALLTKAIFEMQIKGYKPILAHPERYSYYKSDIEKYKEIKDKGVYFQLNINSLSGYYNESAKKTAEKLIDANLIDFVGSDTHHDRHIQSLKKSVQLPYYKKLLKMGILNNTLL